MTRLPLPLHPWPETLTDDWAEWFRFRPPGAIAMAPFAPAPHAIDYDARNTELALVFSEGSKSIYRLRGK